MKHTVIIGGGFAGVNLARELARSAGHRITLIDKNNYNFFPPLIYQVAAGFMSPSDISYPFRKLFNRRPNARFRQGEVRRIDSAECRVYLQHGGSVDYDLLVIATGTRPNFFGNQEIERHAYAMKTLGDALAIRNNILARLEAACALPPAERAPYLHFVVAGGGASGVELTGIFAEMRRDIFNKDYPELQGEHSRLTLVTADPVLLPMSASAQRYTAAELHRLGADVICNDRVTGYDGHTVRLESGRSIAAKSLIWTAGVTARRTDGIPDECYTRGNRLRTDRQLRVIGLDNVYALGDCALVEGERPRLPERPPPARPSCQSAGAVPCPRPAVRQRRTLCIQTPGRHGHHRPPLRRGRLPGGRSSHGILTWAVWVAVHILALVTFRNRLAAAYNWGIAFLTRNQTLRMIIRPTPPADAQNGRDG